MIFNRFFPKAGFLLLYICTLLVFGAVEEEEFPCGISTVDRIVPSRIDKIIGGRFSPPNSWPWTGALLRNGLHRCGCVLVSETIVLTAAHCLAATKDPRKYTVILGGHSVYAGKRFAVRKVIRHPLHNLGWARAFDFGLLELKEEVEFNESMLPACLPRGPPLPNQECVVSGWGAMSETGPKSGTMKDVKLPIVPTWICNDRFHYRGRIHVSMLCAGLEEGGKDACQGDSGGPLVCQRLGVWEINGVVSWGSGCGRPRRPGVYGNVILVVGWIRVEITKSRLERKLREQRG